MAGSKVIWRDSASVWGVSVFQYIHAHTIYHMQKGYLKRTTRPPRANSPITRATRIATNIPHLRIEQPFPLKRLAEQVLHAPKAARGDGAFLRVGREVGGGAAFGVEGEAGGGGEGAEEAGEEAGHRGGHDEEEDGENEGG